MQRFNDTEGYNPRESNVLRMLGYFSLIGLQRVHTLVGDYHGALKAIYPLNLFEVGYIPALRLNSLLMTRGCGSNALVHFCHLCSRFCPRFTSSPSPVTCPQCQCMGRKGVIMSAPLAAWRPVR